MFVCGGAGYGIYNDSSKNPYTGLIIGVLIGLGLGFITANIFERFII
jgi:F0F1-type ATP synthase assembly protein I